MCVLLVADRVMLYGASFCGGAVCVCVLFMLVCLCVVCGLLRDVVWLVFCVCFDCARVCDYVFVFRL